MHTSKQLCPGCLVVAGWMAHPHPLPVVGLMLGGVGCPSPVVVADPYPQQAVDYWFVTCLLNLDRWVTRLYPLMAHLVGYVADPYQLLQSCQSGQLGQECCHLVEDYILFIKIYVIIDIILLHA